MKMNETVAGLTITAKTEGVEQAKKQVDGLTQSTEQLGTVSETTSKRVLSLEDAWKRQTLKLDEAARAQANIARETKLADAALREGVATQAQHAQRLEQINQRYTTAATATKEFGNQTGLARHELINLGRQAQDVGVSLVSGQSPLMILAQQGSQIADVFISSGKSVGSFFSQAIGWAGRFFTSTAGIVTGIAAIGAAAVYAASQFVRAQTTVEEALKEQIRLEKEVKALIDGKATAEDRARAQARGQTEFEALRNELDLRIKLNNAMQDAVKLARSRSTRPMEVPGEMGMAPTGIAPSTDPGLAKIAAAADTLKAALDSGLPGLKAFNDELGRIGKAHPELAQTVEDLIKANQEGAQLETAAFRAKAYADALRGVATNAQLAAAGLNMIAQNELNRAQTQQTADAAERSAAATLQMAQAYPAMSIEVAKQLNALQGQLQVAQARTGLEAINVQYFVTQNALLLQGKTLEEAMAVAAAQRAVALAQVNAQADRQLKTLQNEYEIIRASSEEEKGRIKARQEYNKLIEEGVDSSKAGAIASQMQANARATQDASDATESWSVQMDNANDAINRVTGSLGSTRIALDGVVYAWSQISAYTDSFQFSMAGIVDYTKNKFNPAGYESSYDPLMLHGNAASDAFLAGQNKYGNTSDRFKELFAANTDATKENTAATQTMTDVLSPFYSSDPRRTHLGFRSFAGGGIMTPYGELPLKQYQGGGIANSPQVAVYGEGSTPEAYVPVPAGRIPVEIRQPANSNQRPVQVTINVMGNADANTVAALKATAFQQAQTMRRAMG